jgi:hypothetical protein
MFGRKAGEVCPACWSEFQTFVCEDERTEQEQKDHPVTEKDRTTLACACSDSDDLRYPWRD